MFSVSPKFMLGYYAVYLVFILVSSSSLSGFDLFQGIFVGSIAFIFIIGFVLGYSVESAERQEKENHRQIEVLKQEQKELAEKVK